MTFKVLTTGQLCEYVGPSPADSTKAVYKLQGDGLLCGFAELKPSEVASVKPYSMKFFSLKNGDESYYGCHEGAVRVGQLLLFNGGLYQVREVGELVLSPKTIKGPIHVVEMRQLS